MLYEYTLDTAAQLEYAKRWAYGRNPAYGNFDGMGGDCTNFVSQCLRAGGAVMNYSRNVGWYYISLHNRAAAWTSVDYFYQFMINNKEAGPFGELWDISHAMPGDIIQLGDDRRFYHSLFVLSNDGTVRVAAHTNDAYNISLYSYSFQRARCIHIIGARKWKQTAK